MTRIYLIRHATAENRQDTQRARLTPQGLKEAEALAKRLRHHRIDVFYTSSYQRGQRTVEIIAKPHHAEIETSSGLRDIPFQKKSLSETESRWPRSKNSKTSTIKPNWNGLKTYSKRRRELSA